MKPSQALSILAKAAEEARLSLAEHQQVQTAIVVLREMIFPKPIIPGESAKTEKSVDKK